MFQCSNISFNEDKWSRILQPCICGFQESQSRSFARPLSDLVLAPGENFSSSFCKKKISQTFLRLLSSNLVPGLGKEKMYKLNFDTWQFHVRHNKIIRLYDYRTLHIIKLHLAKYIQGQFFYFLKVSNVCI